MKNILIFALILIFSFATSGVNYAANNPKLLTVIVTKILSSEVIQVKDLTSGTQYEVRTFSDSYISKPKYFVSDKLIVSIDSVNGKEVVSIVERERSMPYAIMLGIFFLVVAVVGRFRGIVSIIAMIGSFFFLTSVTIPQILAGSDPVMISILTALIIVPLTFYVSHGFSTQTTLAIVATLIALTITGVLAVIFTQITYLTGYTSDEASAVAFRFGENFKLSNILIAGMIISSMGVLDDVTISQIDIVHSLSRVKVDMKRHVLFAEAMKIGRDHIASLVNTLVLVYVGAALPIFLLIYKTDTPLWIVLQKESIAEEIVRTLVSSIGIILAVPIATFLGVKWGRKQVGSYQKEKLF